MENYSAYLNMSSVPPGAILDRIIHQQNRKKVDVASYAKIIPQRLNDLIKGNRRFTPQNSIALEQCLGIDISGFFYMIQAKYDIYQEQRHQSMSNRPNLEILTKTTFWDVKLNEIDWSKCAKWAIVRVLEYGSTEEIQEISRFYGQDKVVETYRNHNNFRLYDKVKARLKRIGYEIA